MYDVAEETALFERGQTVSVCCSLSSPRFLLCCPLVLAAASSVMSSLSAASAQPMSAPAVSESESEWDVDDPSDPTQDHSYSVSSLYLHLLQTRDRVLLAPPHTCLAVLIAQEVMRDRADFLGAKRVALLRKLLPGIEAGEEKAFDQLKANFSDARSGLTKQRIAQLANESVHKSRLEEALRHQRGEYSDEEN